MNIIYHGLSIDATAHYLKVSTATVYNWIKANYLVYDEIYGVDYESIINFQQNIAGVDKLNKRANKSELDTHNHHELIEYVQNNLNQNDIADIYQNSLAHSYKNKEGIYYTPQYICESILNDIPKPQKNQTFCDPCCGGGNFILAAIEKGFEPKNIYGFDVDPIAVQITKQRILKKTGFYSENNILCVDYLKNPPDIFFDVIATNPPWGKKILKIEKEKYAKNLHAGKSVDTSSLFFFQILNNVKENGFVSLLLPDAFFNITTFQDARRRLLAYKIISIKDFENAFTGIQAKAQSFCLQKINNPNNQVTCYLKKKNHKRDQNSFWYNFKHIINFRTNDEEQKAIEQIYSKPYITLKNNAKWALGIVTGNNKKFIYKEKGNTNTNLIPVYRGADIYPDDIKEASNFLHIKEDVSYYQQVPPLELFEAKEKIIYRFISNKLICYYDTNRVYCLNSANICVVDDTFPVSMKNITKLLNSDVYNWLFQKLFNTHKVLRSDLESLPIPVDFFDDYTIFDERSLLEYFHIKKDNYGSYTIKS